MLMRLLVANLALFGGVFASEKDRREWCTGTPRPFYRAWSNETYNADHLYSASLAEINNAAPRYKREQDCCLVFTDRNQTVQPLVPLYRLWNSAHWDHFYTINAAERANAIAGGFNDEGIAAYVAAQSGCNTVPLYRLYRDDAYTLYDHFYTIDVAERDRMLATGKYIDEGIAAYVWPLE